MSIDKDLQITLIRALNIAKCERNIIYNMLGREYTEKHEGFFSINKIINLIEKALKERTKNVTRKT